MIYEAFVLMGGNRIAFLFIVFLEERECVEKLGMMYNGLVSTFPFCYASIAEKHHLPSQQRLPKLRILKKMGCLKTCWDQARLSSLVLKKVGIVSEVGRRMWRINGGLWWWW